jgi:hypothetical protein
MSDLIGFSYSGLEPERAAADLLERFRRVGEGWEREGLAGDPVVSVILDGENAWEYFRDGGRVFLRTLYEGLRDDPGLSAITPSEALATAERPELSRVFAGSWIHADFSVWIGHEDDRRAWDLLGEARDALAQHGEAASPEDRQQAWEAFRAACGSDWCWWYGDDHHSENDFEFDRLFRRHLQAIYRRLGLPVPEALEETLITTRRPEVRQSRPTGEVLPVLDGRITSPEEWIAAGVHRVPIVGGAMRRGPCHVESLRFGVGGERLHLMVETRLTALELLARGELAFSFPGPTTLRYRLGTRDTRARSGGARGESEEGLGSLQVLRLDVRREERTGMGWVRGATEARAAAVTCVEVSIPLSELRPGPGRKLEFRVLVLQGDVEVERHPEVGPIEISLGEVTRD